MMHVTFLLTLCHQTDALAAGTIETVLPASDLELGMAALLGQRSGG
jgi:hypothetical protein